MLNPSVLKIVKPILLGLLFLKFRLDCIIQVENDWRDKK